MKGPDQERGKLLQPGSTLRQRSSRRTLKFIANNQAIHFGAHVMNAQMRRRLALQIAATKHGLPIRYVDGASESVAKRITASDVTRKRSRRARRALHTSVAADRSSAS